MTKRQIEILRRLIKAEIDYAINEYVYKNPWCYEMEEDIDKYWEEFAETFNSTHTEPVDIEDMYYEKT